MSFTSLRFRLAATLLIGGLIAGSASASPASGPTSKPSTRPHNNTENRAGYTGASFIYPKGTVTVADVKVTSKQGLEVSTPIYKESPNSFDLPWSAVEIRGKDSQICTGIETSSHANFLTLAAVTGRENELIWLPFEGIKSITAESVAEKAIPPCATIAEAYGRFQFLYTKPGAAGRATLKLKIELYEALANGENSITGMVGDGDTVRIFDGAKWCDMPWSSVSTITFVRRGQIGATTTSAPAVPRFTYRAQGAYNNVWTEYAIPPQLP